MSRPTIEKYDELQKAYDFFNHELFDGELKNCLITLQKSQFFGGYFSRDRWNNRIGEIVDEIAINPHFFNDTNADDVFSTLVHEMAHLWQKHFGKCGRGRYHNLQWADKMESIGLMPSRTGHPNGRRTGDSMSHYIIENGKFAQSLFKLKQNDFSIIWFYRSYPYFSDGRTCPANPSGNGSENNSNRAKYTCSKCHINAWGKPKLNLICGTCNEKLVPKK